MFTIIIEKVWSSNRLLPKASIIKTKLGSTYHSALATNAIDSATYRLKLSLVKKNKVKN